MWSPLAAVLLLVATGQGIAIAALLAQRRQVALALRGLELEVRAVMRAAEQASELGALPLEEEAPTRPIGFRS